MISELKKKEYNSVENKAVNNDVVKPIKIDRNAKLFVEKDSLGTEVVRAYAKSIFSNDYDEKIHFNLLGDVTLYEFKTGKVIIEINGRRMTINDLNYRK